MRFRLPQPVFAPADSPAGGDAPAASGGSPPAGGDNPATMPEGLPAQFWDQQSGQVNMGEFVKSYGELSTFKTQQDEHLAGLPQKAEDYKIELKLPEGTKVPKEFGELKINENDPRIPALRQFAHENKLTQDQVSGLVALHAQAQIAEYEAATAEIQAEMGKLGQNGKARTDAADAWLKANMTAEEHAAMRPFIANAVAFAGLEKLIARATKQGVPPNANGDSDNPPPAPRKRPADVFYGQRTN